MTENAVRQHGKVDHGGVIAYLEVQEIPIDTTRNWSEGYHTSKNQRLEPLGRT